MSTLGNRWYLDLLRQVRKILLPSHGGTGNAQGWGNGVLKACPNGTSSTIPRGTVVTMMNAWNDARVAPSSGVADVAVLGVVVGVIENDGSFTDADVVSTAICAVLVNGTCQVLISAAVTRGQYAFSDGAGNATSSGTLAAGAFGRFQASEASGTATIVLFGAVSFATGSTSFGTPGLTLGTANAAGAATTAVRTDATLLVFDGTTPAALAFGGAGAVGAATTAPRRDHGHPMPANPNGGRVNFAGIIRPSQLVANTDNWAPTGYAAASIVLFSTDANRNITGFAAGADGDRVVFGNTGTQLATFKHNVTSTAANRWLCPNDEDLILPKDAWVEAVYDATSARWRLGDVDYGTPVTQAFGDSATAGTIATHRHGMPAGPPAGTTGLSQYGSGLDGAFDLDGVNTFDASIMSLSGSTYTLARDIEATSFRVRNAIILITNGYKVFARSSITNDTGGTIQNNGNAGGVGAANNPGAALTGNTVGNSRAAGSGATSGAAGNNGTATDTNGAGGGPGGTGGASGGGQAGGTGGGARSSVNAGVTAPSQGGIWGAAGKARPFNVVGMVMGLWSNANLSGAQFWGGGAGGGGGGRTATGTGASGGGGGGGGVLVLLSPTITNNGTIQCNGGVGGASTASVGGGGGGGGGGGLIGLLCDSHVNGGTEQCLGGAAGASTGTGTAAVAGGAGNVVVVLNQ